MRGFQDKNITPYAHSLMTHAPEEVEEIGPLEPFNGEALEKLNDELKKNHLRQTNCKDICVTLSPEASRNEMRAEGLLQAVK